MLLRASGEKQGERFDLQAVTQGDAVQSGVRGGEELTAFTDSVVAGDEEAIARARERLRSTLGDAATVDAAAVIGNFERMVRIADGTGIPLDKPVAMVSADMRRQVGIDAFTTAANTPPVRGVARWAGRALSHALPLVLRIAGRRSRPAGPRRGR